MDILRRNLRWIIAPVFAGLVISTVVAYMLDDSFRSSALIRIVPQQIPDSLVQNATTQELEDHINTMAANILSRNTLTNMITTYHLYPSDLKSEPMEDVIDKMKKAISIQPTEGVANLDDKRFPAMRVSFMYSDREKAKQVCDDIVSRFMTQNEQQTLESHQGATEFLTDEQDRAKKELNDLDQKLADFRQKNAGRLPEQMEMNGQQLNGINQRIAALNDQLDRNTEQRMMLESNMRIMKQHLDEIKDVTPQAQAANERVTELNHQIENLQLQIANMKNVYKDDFPDLVQARQQLAVLQQQREEALKQKPVKLETTVENPATVHERQDTQAQIDHIEAQLKAVDLEKQQMQSSLAQANSELQVFQARLNGIPASEKEYMQLMNDRALAQQHYADLVARTEKSSLSMDMERRKEGESLEIIDSASLPLVPEAPKRPTDIAFGPGIGLALGIILVAIREMKDTSLKNLKDARLYTQLSVLGSIPLLENDLVVQRRKQMLWMGWLAGTVAGLAIMAVAIAHYYLTKA